MVDSRPIAVGLRLDQRIGRRVVWIGVVPLPKEKHELSIHGFLGRH